MELGHVVSENNITVQGSIGLTDVTANIVRDVTDTFKIKTRLGYELEGTPEHGLKVLGVTGPEWCTVGDLKSGDLVGIQFNQQLFNNNDDISDIKLSKRGTWAPPSQLNEELANIIGLFIAEGSYSYNQLRIYNIGKEIIDRLVNNTLGLNFVGYPKSQCVYLCNARFIEFLRKLGFPEHISASTKSIPSRLLECSRLVLRALLSGMFDGDGHSNRRNGSIGYTSTSTVLINQVRMLLLNFGMLSKLQKDKRTTRRFKVSRGGKCDRVSRLSGAYQITCSTLFSKKFYKEIGFGVKYKQDKMLCLTHGEQQLFGLNNRFSELKRRYGCGSLGYNSIRKVISAKYCTFETACKKIVSWSEWSDDPNYRFISDRLDEFDRPKNCITWLPIISITPSQSPVCEITVAADDHTYIANGFISHNSQISRTVILAFVKKEGRDRKNAPAYRDHLCDTGRVDEDRLKRFFSEATQIAKYNEDHLKCLEALHYIIKHDDKPYDGLIGKLVERSGLSRIQINIFIKLLRLRSHEFTDSPLSQENDRDRQARKQFLYQDEE
jgi:hypothetical protein